MLKTRLNILTPILFSFLTSWLLTFIASFYLSFIAYGRKNSPNFVLMTLIAMILSFLTIFIVYYLYLKKNNRDFLHEMGITKYNLNLRLVIISILTTMLNMLIISTLIYLFGDGSTSSVSNEIENNTKRALEVYSGAFPVFVSVLYPVIVAPIMEELLFRGMFGSLFRVNDKDTKMYMKVLFVIVSALVFGTQHFQGNGTLFGVISSFAFPAVSGVIYSTIYLKEKNIAAPIIVHSMYNLSIVLFSAL